MQPDIDGACAHLHGARRAGAGWRIPCPVHGGSDANCYIGPGDDGGVVAKCWSRECAWQDIIDALGLRPDKGAGYFVGAYAAGQSSRNVYRQNNADGKRIWGRGKADGCELLVRDLRPGLVIVIAEGEKAADAIERAAQRLGADYTGASWRGGTSSAAKADYSAVKGRRVIIWPDNDAVGRKAANTAARCCLQAGASSIRMVDVGDLPEAGDAADIHAEDVIAHLQSAASWKPDERGGLREGAGRPASARPERVSALAETLLEADPSRFLSVEKLAHARLDSGEWTLLGTDRLSHVAIEDAAAHAGIKADAGKDVRDVIVKMYGLAPLHPDVRRVVSTDINRPIPIVPLHRGGAYHLGTGEEMDADDYALQLQTARGWSLPDLGGPPDAHMATFIRRWDGIWERLAALLLHPVKAVDTIISTRSGMGKSLLVDALEAALPQMVGRLPARQAFGTQGDRFSSGPSMLASHRIVFFDECGQPLADEKAVSLGAVNALAENRLTVERKGIDAMNFPRAGTAVLIGHAPPPGIDYAAQGVEERLRWAHILDDSYHPPLTEEDYHNTTTPAAIAHLRSHILGLCSMLWMQHDGDLAAIERATLTDAATETARDLIEDNIDPLIAGLREAFTIERGAFISSSELQDAVFHLVDDMPKGKEMLRIIRVAFHGRAKSGRAYIDGVQVRGWKGLTARTDF